MPTALITGASSGIGWELAKVLAQQNFDLILVARNLKKLEELKQLLGPHKKQIDLIPMDLIDSDAPLKLFSETQKMGRTVDVLVNNAGFGEFGEFINISRQRQRDMVSLNISALTDLCHLYLPEMLRKQNGHIVNIASTAAFQPGPTMAVYYATKAYVLHFSEALSEELLDKNVFVTAICPGPTHSGFQAAAHLDASGLFKIFPIPSSEAVAKFTWKAMQKRQVVAIHGTFNWILSQSGRFAPRALVRKITKWIMRNK